MNVREIWEDETEKLYGCMKELSDYHNEVSVHFKGSYPSHAYADTLTHFKQQIHNGVSRAAVVEAENKIVGFCKIDLQGTSGKLDYLVVSEVQRGKGYGRALMDWAMNVFRQQEISFVEVKVVDGNPTIHLYEKYGFRMNAHILRCDISEENGSEEV